MTESVQSKIFEEIDNGNLEHIKEIYEKETIPKNVYNEDGMTALMQAAYKGQTEICRFLLVQGADVNATCHENNYTALMMACLSGKLETVQLLLDNDADSEKLNSVQKTAAQLASFVGQHECATAIKNFLSLNKLEPYIVCQGVNDPRLPEEAAGPLQKLVVLSNPHPVKIVLFIKDSPELCDVEVIKKAENVLMDLCSKCVRSKNDYDEVLALKLFYYSSILKICYDFAKQNGVQKWDALAKKLLHSDGDGFQVTVENIIRKSLQQFPYIDMPLLQYFVKTIAPVKIGSDPTALSCLFSMFSGMHAASQRHNICETCATNASPLKCSRCKKVCYCSKQCQKLHWFIHKKHCST
uniref:Ankyrin repeat and MYND domain-containing protein 2 n=1 Tax=Phallusia mammillata TaxID=59560 RepID=A0A6F9D718_9ASCI|nr:ankyrin repeat and MYND domain-containing protein 2 [Phallusia mammillata]